MSLAQAWPAWRDRVREAGALVLFLDFDGTLVHLARTPGEVRLEDEVAGHLTRLARRPGVFVVILSGRPGASLARLATLPGVRLIGSHGFEMPLPLSLAPAAAAARSVVERGAGDLERLVSGFPGAWLELKASGATVHYRAAADELHPRIAEAVAAWLRRETAREQALSLTSAHQAVEIRPRLPWGKAEAARWWLEAVGPPQAHESVVLIAGDDEVDEELFRAWRAQGFTLRVGGVPERTSALAWVPGPPEVWDWLEEVDALRAERETRADSATSQGPRSNAR